MGWPWGIPFVGLLLSIATGPVVFSNTIFFWTIKNAWMQTGIVAALLLVMFLALDVWRYRREVHPPLDAALAPIRVQGKINFVLILLIISSILGSAAWQPDIAFDVYGTKVQLQNLMRDVGLIAIAMLSLLLTPDTHREANDFTWEPTREVAKLFAGIFIVIIPVSRRGKAAHFPGYFRRSANEMARHRKSPTSGSRDCSLLSSITSRRILSSSRSPA